MTTSKEQLIDNGADKKQLDKMETLLETAVRETFDEYDESLETPQETIQAYIQELYKFILDSVEKLDLSMETHLSNIESDLKDSKSARSVVLFLTGALSTDTVDTLFLSEKILSEHYRETTDYQH